MTRVHAADGSLLAEYAKERRLYLPIQAIPKLVTNAFVAAEDKNFYHHPGIDIYGIMRAGMLVCRKLRQRPPSAGRFDHHPAGRQKLSVEQQGFVRAQDQGGAAGAAHRAHVLEAEDPRTLSQRNLSRLRRVRYRRRLAALFRQIGARTEHCPGRLSRRPAEGPQQLQSVPARRKTPSRAAIMSSTAWSRTASFRRPTAPARKKSPSTSPSAPPIRTSTPPNISPKKCAAISMTITERRSSTRAGSRCAPRSIPSCRCWRATPWSTVSSISTRSRAIAVP